MLLNFVMKCTNVFIGSKLYVSEFAALYSRYAFGGPLSIVVELWYFSVSAIAQDTVKWCLSIVNYKLK